MVNLPMVLKLKTQEENTCKSPMGMFEDKFIPNDLQFVKDCIEEYNQ